MLFGTTTSPNEQKRNDFYGMLEQHGLGHCFAALKGNVGEAVQLQHVMKLKKIALSQGEDGLTQALGDAGVANGEDQKRLAKLLCQKLEKEGGLPMKPPKATSATNDTDAWKVGLATDESGTKLPAELEDQKDTIVAKDQQVGSNNADTNKDDTIVDINGERWPAGMKIVNGHLANSIRVQKMLKDGNPYGYIHLAAEMELPSPLFGNSDKKKQLLNDLKVACKELQQAHPQQVQRADVFDAFIIPPGSKEGREVLKKGQYDVHIAEFDIVVLVECTTPEAAIQVGQSKEFQKLKHLLDIQTRFVHCIVAKNTKRIDEVNKDTDGIFLFNYFYAANVTQKGSDGITILQSVWEYTAGWWTAYANLTNSTPLLPLDDVEEQLSEYSWINHCRWDRGIDIFPHLLFRPSLDQFVLQNFTANDIMAMPILYHLA